MFARAVTVLGCAAFVAAQESLYTQSNVFQRFTLPQCADGQYREDALPEFGTDVAGIIGQVQAGSSASQVLQQFRQALGVRLQHGVDVIDGNRQCALDTIASEQASRFWTARRFQSQAAQRRTVIAAVGAVVKRCAKQGSTVLLGRGASRCSTSATPSSVFTAVEASHDLAVHTAFNELTSNYQDRVHVALRRLEDMLRDLDGKERSLDGCSRRLALSVYGRVMLYVGRLIQYPARGSRGPQQSTVLLDRVGRVAYVVDELARANGCTQPGL